MKAKEIVFTAPGKAELLATEVEEPTGRQVLVKLLNSTISSGTEKANLSGEENVTIAKNAKVDFPRRLGYSAAGIVEATGNEVQSVKEGDRVIVSWGRHCSHVLIGEENIHKVESKHIATEDASMLLIGTFPLAAIRKCRLEIGEAAMVMGLGVLGQMAVQLLRIAGAAPVLAVDLVQERRDLALKLGADYALDSSAPDFEEVVRGLTDGGVHAAIEVTGKGQGLDSALDCMAKFGRVALLGCTRNSDFTIDYYKKVHGPGISLIGAHTLARPDQESSPALWTTRDDIKALMRLLDGGRLDFSVFSRDVRSPEEAQEVYTRLMNDPAFPVTQFDWTRLQED